MTRLQIFDQVKMFKKQFFSYSLIRFAFKHNLNLRLPFSILFSIN